MKTRVIQDVRDGPSLGENAARPATDPARSAGFVEGLRRWSTEHRKLASLGRAGVLAAVVLAAAFVASRPGSSDASTVAGAPTDFATIDRFVEAEMGAQRIPGLALGIVRGDRVAHLRGFGEADSSGRPVTPQTPFIIGSLSKSVTALAVMQLVEAGKVELDAPVQRYLPWFRVADEQASARITVRHLLNQTSGLSTKTGRSFQGSGDTDAGALEAAVRKLSGTGLTAPVGETHQYSTVNYSVLGLVVQAVSGQSYETYVQQHVFSPLRMRHSFTSEEEARSKGLATGHHYWFGRPRAADLPYNRGLLPAGYLISSAEDMGHYLIAQLEEGRYRGAAVLSPAGIAELHRPAVPTATAGTSYGMGWFVGPVNGIPAVFHQGETFNFHANVVLSERGWGVVVLMNAENSLDDLVGRGRQARIAEGVTSLLAGRRPAPPPSNAGIFAIFAIVFAVIALQTALMIRWALALRRRRLPRGRLGSRRRIALALLLNLAWAALVLVVLPQRMLGLPLQVIATGIPDVGYTLLASGLVALGWGITRTAWAFFALRKPQPSGTAAQLA
jgi:CubicO group peptidase (beta-lactamase class C family)